MTENILQSYFSISRDETFPPGKKKTIAAAIKLFAKQGYHGTSTLQIAKEAGVSQATVFKYFKTKEDLLHSIIVPVIPKLFLNFLKRTQNTSSLEELINYVVEDRMAFLKENKDTIKIIYSEMLTNENLKTQLINSLKVEFAEINFKAILQKYKENNPEINENLSIFEIIRSFAGPIITYSVQSFIFFEHILCPTEEHDLQFIKQQIYKNLTI